MALASSRFESVTPRSTPLIPSRSTPTPLQLPPYLCWRLSKCRAQDSAGRPRLESRPHGALYSRSKVGGGVESSQHGARLRNRARVTARTTSQWSLSTAKRSARRFIETGRRLGSAGRSERKQWVISKQAILYGNGRNQRRTGTSMAPRYAQCLLRSRGRSSQTQVLLKDTRSSTLRVVQESHL